MVTIIEEQPAVLKPWRKYKRPRRSKKLHRWRHLPDPQDPLFEEKQERREKWKSNRRGRLSELNFLHAFRQTRVIWPEWFIKVRDVTMDEDCDEGIDAVLETIWGPVNLQIKSSFTGIKKYKAQRGENGVHLVLVEPDTPSYAIIKRTVAVIRGKLDVMARVANT